MRAEKRVTTLENKVYWVTDNNGIEHLCHDSVHAQWLEDRYKMQAKEKEKNETKDAI